MPESLFAAISIVIEFTAAALAVRRIQTTGQHRPWIFFSAAIFALGVWHTFGLFPGLMDNVRLPLWAAPPLFRLLFSVFLLAGVVWSAREERSFPSLASTLQPPTAESQTWAILKGLPALLASADGKTGEFVFLDGAVREITGYSSEDFLRDTALGARIIHPEDQERIRLAYQGGLAKGEPFECEYRIVHGEDGHTVWLHSRIVPVIGSDGALLRHDTVATDITPRKEAEELLREYRERLEEMVQERTAELAAVNERLEQEVSQHKQTTEALRESELRYRTLFEAAPIGIGVTDFEGNVIDCNPYMAKMTGLSPEELVAAGIRAIYADAQDRAPLMQQLRDTGKFRDREVRLRRKDGSLQMILANADVGELGGGKVILTTALDITEKKLAEERIQESERQYRTLVEHSLQGLVIVAGDPPRPVFANQASADLLGYSVEEILSLSPEAVRNLVYASDREAMFQRIRDRIAGKKALNRYEFRAVRKDGEIRWMEIFAVRMEYKGQPAAHAVIVDITERKRAEESLKTEKEFTEVALNAQTDTFFVFEIATGRAVRWNQAFQRVSGYSAEEIRNMKAPDSYYSEPDLKRAAAATNQVLSSGSTTIEMSLITKEGRSVPTEYTGSSIRDDDGNPKYIIAVGRDVTERKRAEEALRHSEHQLRSVLDSLGDAVHVVDQDLRIVLVNEIQKQWCRKVGLGADLVGHRLWEALPFLSEGVLNDYRKVLETGQLLISEERNVIEEKEYFTDVRKIPLFDNGKVSRVLIVLRDITDRKRAETALRESEQKYRSLVEHSLQGVVIVQGTPPRAVFANSTVSDFLGYTPDEILAFSPEDMRKHLHPDDRDSLMQRLQDRLVGKAGPGHYEVRMIRKSGEVRWFEIYSSTIEYAGKPAAQEVFIDITERKRAEETLRESEERYRTLFELSPSGIMVENARGEIIDVNPAVCQSLGYSKQELVGMPVGQLTADPPETVQSNIDSILAGERLSHVVADVRKDGSRRFVELHETRIPMPDGTGGIMVVSNDITERIQADERLRQSEKTYREAIRASDAIPYRYYFGTEKQPAMYDFSGADVEDLLGIPVDDAISHEEFQKLVEEVTITDASRAADETDRRRAFQRGDIDRLRADLRIRTPQGEIKWLSNSAIPLRDESTGRIIGSLGILQDVTYRKQVEEKLREREESERQFRQQLATLVALGNELSKAESLDELCRQAVELGRERLGFERLGICFIDETRDFTVGTFGTDESGRTRDERGIRVPISRQDQDVVRREAAPHTVVQENRELHDDRGRTVGSGMHVYAGLWDGEDVIGFLNADNFLSGKPITDWQCELLSTYASTLGHLASRARAMEAVCKSEESERRFRGQLAVMVSVSNELSKTHSLDALCRRAVELGRERLAYERLGICFLDEEHKFTIGMFGTDESGHTRDERGIRVPITAEAQELARREAGPRTLVEETGELRDDRGQKVGVGMHVYAALWDGEDIIGFLNADNLLTQKTITPQECAILSMYATTLAHLAVRARAMEALQESEAKYRLLVENQTDLVVKIDPEGRFLFASPSFCKLVEKEEDELLGQEFMSLISTADEERFHRVIQDVLRSPHTVELEHRAETRIGWRWLAWAGSAVLNENGDVDSIVAVGRDITDRKEIEEKLRRNEEIYRQAIEAGAGVPFAMHAHPGRYPLRFNYIGRNITPLLGISPEDLTPQKLTKMIEETIPTGQPAPRNVSEYDRAFREGRIDRYQTDLRVRTPDGRTKWLSSAAVPLLDEQTGEVTGALGILQDITGRKQVEEQLREREDAERRFRERLAALVAIGNELYQADTFDDLCRLAVELGHERLGLDRLGITLLDRDESTTIQTFGIDETGKLRDERGLRVPLAPETRELARQRGVLQTVVQQDTVLRNGRGQPVGRGTHVFSSLWDGEKLIGFLNVDNLLSRRPFSEQECELVAMYASTLAHLASRARAMEALRKSEARYHSLFENCPISLAEQDYSTVRTFVERLHAQGITNFRDYFETHPEAVKYCAESLKVLDVNTATVELFEADSKAELQGPVNKIFCPESYDSFKQELAAVAAGTDSFENETITRTLKGNRKHLLLKWSQAPGYEQSTKRVYVSVADITRLKEAEQSLRLLSSAVEQSTEGIAVTDLEGKIIFVNEAYAGMHHCSAADLVNRHIVVLHSSEQQGEMERANRQVRETGSFAGEMNHARRDGTTFPALLHNSLLRNGAGQPVGIIETVRDISELKRVEEELRKQRDQLQRYTFELMTARDEAQAANRAKTTFLANISHELRTPLNSIIGFSQRVLRKSERLLPEQEKQNLRKITESAGHLTTLIDQLLDMSKIEADRMDVSPVTFDIAELIRETTATVQPMMQANHNRLVTLIPENVPSMHNDRMKVRQILLNLLSNAAKFTQQGRVTLSVHCAGKDEKDKRAATETISISVRDNGIGMTKEQIAYVFDPFRQADDSSTRKYGGTGLGLTISRRLAELLGGRITATSELGKGSTFTVHLPATVKGKHHE